ncbi:MAG TPA: carbohydrate ABC transporter permease [Candidatus Limnocylindria bacterium]|nr:carbohydrate ABC transporter permease [Candidatus Limnocylindria bacterium]
MEAELGVNMDANQAPLQAPPAAPVPAVAALPARPLSGRKWGEGMGRFNRVHPFANLLYSLLFILLALACVLPVVFVIIISFTDEASIAAHGYSFFPVRWAATAYEYLAKMRDTIGRAFLNSLGVTFAGTLLGLTLTTTMGYALSRRTYRLRKFFTWYIFIPMLFHGGLLSTYVVNTQLLGLKNTYLALILPLACSSFYVIILRTFFSATVPDEIIESGKMDGASQLRIFAQLVLPIALPAIATIGLFLTFAYWNDWYQAMLYIATNRRDLYPLQYVLVNIEKDITYLTNNASVMSADSSQIMPSETMRMAIVVLIVLPIMFSYPFFQKYFISGLTIGAVKG